MTNQEKFIENVNRVLQEVDYKKLDQSCNGENPEYAKEVLEQMHEAFLSAYGSHDLERNEYEFVELPAVIRGRNSGRNALGIVTLNLQFASELCRAYIFTPHGVVQYGDAPLMEIEKKFLRKNFLPFDYWYTPVVEGDIHVDFEDVPESVQSLLQTYRQGQAEQPEDGMGMNL